MIHNYVNNWVYDNDMVTLQFDNKQQFFFFADTCADSYK